MSKACSSTCRVLDKFFLDDVNDCFPTAIFPFPTAAHVSRAYHWFN